MLAARVDIEVISAGTSAFVGMSPTEQTKALLLKEGIDVSGHIAQKLSTQMLKRADLILVMEKLQEENIFNMLPMVKNRVYLLKEFAKMSDNDLSIYDPMGNSEEFYQSSFNTIKEAVAKIAQII